MRTRADSRRSICVGPRLITAIGKPRCSARCTRRIPVFTASDDPATINELARAADIGIGLLDRALPIPEEVRDACGLLGLDPLEVANEGKLLAIVPADDADRVLAAMRRHPLGRQACIIGQCTTDHPQVVTLRTGLGATRVLTPPIGEQLPRIC